MDKITSSLSPEFLVPEEDDGFVAIKVVVGNNVYINQGPEGFVVGSREQARQLAQGILERLSAANRGGPNAR